MRRGIALLVAMGLTMAAMSQEVLLPLQRAEVTAARAPRKAPTAALGLPFFDDFAAGSGLDPMRWQPVGGATLTQDVSPLAPTVGVATLDALDGAGELHAGASTELFPADTLTSWRLQLDGLTPADSVVLSFYYLPGGGYGNLWERLGDAPDDGDSLFVDFFRPADSSWVMVWACGGTSVDTLMALTGQAWQYVALPLREAVWYDSAFCFRFRNYASLQQTAKVGMAGNCDYWHVDYVMVDRGRDAAVEDWHDVAFAAPAPSMLNSYRAMPFRHYTASAMAPSVEMTIANLYSYTLASHYGYGVYDAQGNEVYRYDGGFENAPARGYQTVAAHARPEVGFAFPAMSGPSEFTVIHTVREGTGGDAYGANDTVRYRQQFAYHYAYDDGTAENGYGLTSTASSVKLAYRFDLGMRDTLTAVDCYFNRTLDEQNALVPFYLTLWSVGDDGAPDEVIYRDETRRLPHFGGFAHYVLEAPVVVEGAVFVGFEQSGNDYINMGFDRSMNTADRIYYLTGTEWQQSILSGSLMMHPCFGAAAAVGMEEVQPEAWTVYPNPADERLVIEEMAEGMEATLFDIQGRRVASTCSSTLDTRRCPAGLYLLRVAGPAGVKVLKVIIKH